MKNKSKYTKERLVKAVFKVSTYSDLARELTGKEKVHGGTIAYIKKRLNEENINYSHFKNFAFSSNNGGVLRKKEDIIADYFSANPIKRTNNTNLKHWMKKFDLIKFECSECHLKEIWNNKPLVLQLDHIDGNNYNNDLSNLRMICPNCHSQTENFTGKKNKRKNL